MRYRVSRETRLFFYQKTVPCETFLLKLLCEKNFTKFKIVDFMRDFAFFEL